MNKIQEKFYNRAQNLLKYCITCQPYEGGDYIWVLGEQTTVEDILDDIKCPERYRDEIVEHLICRTCGAEVNSRDDVVGTENRYELELQNFVDKAMKKYGEQFHEFNNFLTKYPSLAQKSKLGRKLYKEILEGNLPTIKIKNQEWVRARKVSNSNIFGADDMKAPPLGQASEGRYNRGGQSVLYLAKYKETAYVEVIGEEKPSILWKQDFLISEQDKILDLRYDWTSLSTTYSSITVALLCSRVLEKKVDHNNVNWKPEYYITQYIGDCARLAGYAGVLYNSSKHYGENLVLFYPSTLLEEGKIVPLNEPEIERYKPIPMEEFPF